MGLGGVGHHWPLKAHLHLKGFQGFLFSEIFLPTCYLFTTGKSDLTLNTLAAIASPASKQLALSSGTAQGPHSCELCHPSQAVASASFLYWKCLLHTVDKIVLGKL